MKAAVFRSSDVPLEIEDVPTPDPGPGEALVEVAACGVCHTDLHFLDHGVPTFKAPPIILGHEVSGIVAAVGEDSPVAVGDRVLVPAVIGCGKCSACRTGRENVCDSMRMLGNHMDGGYADFVVVPDHQLVPLPDALPLPESAIIADALTTPYHAVVNRGRVRPGDKVAVYGCGGIGLNVVQMAAAVGAQVVAVDINADRLSLAERLGAEASVNSAAAPDAQSSDAIRELTGGGADVSFECIGRSDTQEQAFRATRNGGRLVLVGYSPRAMTLNSGRVMFREMEVIGSLGCPGVDYHRVVDMVRLNQIQLMDLVTARFPLVEIGSAFDTLRAGRGVRSIVLP